MVCFNEKIATTVLQSDWTVHSNQMRYPESINLYTLKYDNHFFSIVARINFSTLEVISKNMGGPLKLFLEINASVHRMTVGCHGLSDSWTDSVTLIKVKLTVHLSFGI